MRRQASNRKLKLSAPMDRLQPLTNSKKPRVLKPPPQEEHCTELAFWSIQRKRRVAEAALLQCQAIEADTEVKLQEALQTVQSLRETLGRQAHLKETQLDALDSADRALKGIPRHWPLEVPSDATTRIFQFAGPGSRALLAQCCKHFNALVAAGVNTSAFAAVGIFDLSYLSVAGF